MNKQKAATCPLKPTRTTARCQAVARRRDACLLSAHHLPFHVLTKPQTGEHTPHIRLAVWAWVPIPPLLTVYATLYEQKTLVTWPSIPASPEVLVQAHYRLHLVAPQVHSWQRAPAVTCPPGLRGTARKSPTAVGGKAWGCVHSPRVPHLTPEVLKCPYQKGPDAQTWLVQLFVALKEGHGCPGSQTRRLHSAHASPFLVKLAITAAQNPPGIPEFQAVSFLPTKGVFWRRGPIPKSPSPEGRNPPQLSSPDRLTPVPTTPGQLGQLWDSGLGLINPTVAGLRRRRGGCNQLEQGFCARLHRRVDWSPARLPPSPDLRPLVHGEWVRQAPRVGVTRGARQGSPVGRTRRPWAPSPAARAPVLGVAPKPRPATPPRPRLALVGPGGALC